MADEKTEKKKNVPPVGRRFGAGVDPHEAGVKGGRKSGEVRRRNRELKDELLMLLASKGKAGETVQREISLALVKQAANGSVRAFEVIRDTIGEKPAENVNLVASDLPALDSAFQRMAGDDE
jgi:hypothetical protein